MTTTNENKKIANKIKTFLKKYKCNYDTRIYFNGMAYDFDSSGNMTILEDEKASNYMDYANDDGVTLSFEGPLYGALNGHYPNSTVEDAFYTMLQFYGYYFEMGNAWNCNIVKDGN